MDASVHDRSRAALWGRLVGAYRNLAGTLVVALRALGLLLWLLVVLSLCLVGVGLVLVPGALRLVRGLAGCERDRTGYAGTDTGNPPPTTGWQGLTAVGQDPVLRREVMWVAWSGVGALVVALVGLMLPVVALRDLTYPLWWSIVPRELAASSLGLPAHTWLQAIGVALLGVGWVAVTVAGLPWMDAWLQRVSRGLLWPPESAVLRERIEQLSQTRTGALQAHTDELRRIERALHDGAQSRLVAVTIKLGSARRALDRNPDRVPAALEEAQQAAEAALAELRSVVRSIHPPALEHHDLVGALTSLAAGCRVPCTVEAEAPGALTDALRATAYHVVAESITNISRHSGATSARVRLQRGPDRLVITVTDDGHGGADPERGSGLLGIRRRVAAHDGTMTVTSPVGGPTELRVELPCTS